NSSINSLRSRQRRGKLEAEPQGTVSPEQAAIGHQLEQRFIDALRGVSEQHQQVLWLRELRGLSYPEIAQLLRVPEGTVKSALNRGRARLLDLLASRGDLDLAAGES